MSQLYTLTVKTQAKVNEIRQTSSKEFLVAVTAPKQQGKANAAVVDAFAKYLKLPKWKVQIVAGFKSPHKVVEVLD